MKSKVKIKRKKDNKGKQLQTKNFVFNLFYIGTFSVLDLLI